MSDVADPAGQVGAESVQRLLLALGLGAGAGAAIRGGQGLLRLSERKKQKPVSTLMRGPQQVRVPAPAPIPQIKMADEPLQVGSMAQSIHDWFKPGEAGGPAQATGPAPNPSNMSLPTMAGHGALAAGGLVGGYKLVDHFLDKARKREMDAERSEAEKRYQEAFRGLLGPKRASDGLDKAFDQYEKGASDLSTIAALTLAGVAVPSGMWGYNKGKKEQSQRLALKAQRAQNVRNLIGGPLPVNIVPEETDAVTATGPASITQPR